MTASVQENGKFWDWFKFEIAINWRLPLSAQNRQRNGCLMDTDIALCARSTRVLRILCALAGNFGRIQLFLAFDILLWVYTQLCVLAQCIPASHKASLLTILSAK